MTCNNISNQNYTIENENIVFEDRFRKSEKLKLVLKFETVVICFKLIFKL